MWNKLRTLFNSKSEQQDDFIRRIRSLVIGEGMLKDGNIELMNYAIQNMPQEGSVLEIGSYGGLSTNLIIYLMNLHQKNNSFFTCDAWIYEGSKDRAGFPIDLSIDGRKDVLRADYSVYMKNAFINSTQFLSPKNLPFSFHMYSDDFFDNWKGCEKKSDVFGREITLGGHFSFAYIDGGHSYEVVSRDFNNVASNLVLHGFILLDDSGDPKDLASAHLISDIKKDKHFRVVSQNPNYLIQKVG